MQRDRSRSPMEYDDYRYSTSRRRGYNDYDDPRMTEDDAVYRRNTVRHVSHVICIRKSFIVAFEHLLSSIFF